VSAIEWTSKTINFVTGCQRQDACCENCYAERLTATRLSQNPKYAGLTDDKGRFTGQVRYHHEVLDGLLRKKKAELYFVNSMSDTFHKDVKDEWLDRAFATFFLTPQHRYLLLTKRADRMREYMTTDPWGVSEAREWSEMANYVYDRQIRPLDGALFLSGEAGPNLPNVALGVSCGLQESVHRIDDLCATPAAYRFVSVEPMLGPVHFEPAMQWECEECGKVTVAPFLPPVRDSRVKVPGVYPQCGRCGKYSRGMDNDAWSPAISQVIIGTESHGPASAASASTARQPPTPGSHGPATSPNSAAPPASESSRSKSRARTVACSTLAPSSQTRTIPTWHSGPPPCGPGSPCRGRKPDAKS